MYQRIITHNDFDGVISAAICSRCLGIDHIVFTGPRSVSEARLSITAADVVCDLPCPLECGLWFDHHQGNLEEVIYRKIDPATLPGRFEPLPSCAHVVFNHFRDASLPAHFEEMVAAADIIDSFNYCDVEDWRRETPAKIIDAAIRAEAEERESKFQFLRSLVGLLKTHSLSEIADTPGVRKRHRQYAEEEDQMLEQISRDVGFLSQDADHILIVLDLTRHNRRPNLQKHLAFLLHPEAQAVVEIKSLFRNQVKTNDLSLSMSLSLQMNHPDHHKDVGDLMRQLNIGSGHAGAGAGVIHCRSKEEMLKKKQELLLEILNRFRAQ